jgi:hypothetical protein
MCNSPRKIGQNSVAKLTKQPEKISLQSPCPVAEEKVVAYPARQPGKTSNGEVLLARVWSSLDGGISGGNCNPSETAKKLQS